MLSERNAVHPVAQMYAVQPERFEHDGPKTSNQHSDETHTYSHCQCHDPEARLARWKLSKDAARENISREHIQKSEAEDYHCVRNRISLLTVLTNDSDIDTMMFGDTFEQCLHTLRALTIVLRAMTEVLIGPPDRHVFGGDGVEAKMASI
jgi:hypothetical protein